MVANRARRHFHILTHRHQGIKTLQHDTFCIFRIPGGYWQWVHVLFTLILETSPRLWFGEILRKFDKRSRTSALDVTHKYSTFSQQPKTAEKSSVWRCLHLNSSSQTTWFICTLRIQKHIDVSKIGLSWYKTVNIS